MMSLARKLFPFSAIQFVLLTMATEGRRGVLGSTGMRRIDVYLQACRPCTMSSSTARRCSSKIIKELSVSH